MFGLFEKNPTRKQTARALYDVLNDQARQEAFYRDYGVADTVDGRFDLICLHSFLVMSRMQLEGKEGQRMSQALFDVLFKQFEYALREMGIGDLSVPRHVKRMMNAYKGRFFAYQEALKVDDNGMLREVIRRNLFGMDDTVESETLKVIADYIRTNHKHIAVMSLDQLLEAKNVFSHNIVEGRKKNETGNTSRMVA